MAVQDVLYTYNPIHEYEFSWTIENFSHSPDILRGPSLSPIPGFPRNVCLELTYNELNCNNNWNYSLNVSLVNLSVKGSPLVVSSFTTIRNTNDEIFRGARTSHIEFKGSIFLLKYFSNYYTKDSISKSHLSNLINLLDDKMVVNGKLSFSGYDLVSSVSPLLPKDNSEANGEVLKDLKTLYESGLSSDVTFSVGEKTLRAHKNILLCRSPVFAKMFDNDMLESNSNKVVIEDTDYHVFGCFLMFLYTGIVDDKKCDTVLSLYSLAHKYQVKSLHTICSGILGHNLAVDSVCSALVLSDLHGDKVLKELAKVFIRRHISEVAFTTEWAEIVITKPELKEEILASMVSQTAMDTFRYLLTMA